MREKASTLRTRGKNSRQKEPEANSSPLHAPGESEVAFRALAEKSTEPTVLVDKEGRVLYSNSAAANLLGYPITALPGRSIFENIHPRDSGRAQGFFQDALARPGFPILGDFRFRNQGGGYRALGMVAVNRLDTSSFDAVILTYQDITDRQQASETRARLAAIVESSDDAIIAEGLDGTILSWNLAAERVYGWAAEEVLGLPITITVPPDRMDELNECMARARQGDRVDHLETIRVRKDGTRIAVSITLSPIRDDEGNIIGLSKSSRDITGLQAAGETRARLAAVVESSDDAIISETLDGTITSWNRAAERLHGWTRDEAIGRPISMTVPADRMEELKDYMARVRRGERVDHLETVCLRKDGSRLDVSITLSPILDEHRRIIGLSKSSRDITERRRFEAELWRKNIELEIASRAKDAFLASMSHELRTPLNSIIGFTGTMLMKLPGELTEDQERQLQLIQFSARHLLSLINDLLNLAKVQSGKTELQLERVACRPIVQEIGATFRPGAGAKGLRFEVGLPSREVEIHSDRRTLLQILLNLAGNAIKFTEQGTVRVDLEELSPVPGKRREVAFRVTDTGIGIRREDQGRLFQPFEQFHAKRSEADPGSGLGLHLSQRMAYRLGGKIDFTSEPGRGTIFTLRLPAD